MKNKIIFALVFALIVSLSPSKSYSLEPNQLTYHSVDDDLLLSAEASAIASLFSIAFPAEASLVASNIESGNNVIDKLTSQLVLNRPIQENLFSKLLYDSVNKIGEVDSIYPSLSSSSFTTSQLSLDIFLCFNSYFGRSWSLAQNRYFSLETVSKLTSKLTLTDESSSFRVSSFYYISPLVIDLDGNGILDASNGDWLPHPDHWSNLAAFDMDSNGLSELVEWIGPLDGLIIAGFNAEDGDRQLDGSSLFGQGDGWTDGFAKLSLFDSDNNKVLTGDELNSLAVWRDINQNAFTETTEVKSFNEAGITSISLSHEKFKSSALINGSTFDVWDWYPNTFDALLEETIPYSIPSVSIRPLPVMNQLPSFENFDFLNTVIADPKDLELCCVTDGGRIILLQKEKNQTLESQGLHWSIQEMHFENGILQEKKIPLPVNDVVTILPLEDRDGLIIIANSGAKVLSVDLATSSITDLYTYQIGNEGFIFGGQTSTKDNILYNYGSFVSSEGKLLYEALIGAPLTGGVLSTISDLDRVKDTLSSELIGVSLISPKGQFTVSKNDSIYIGQIVNNTLVEFDRGESFAGMWGAFDKVAYILKDKINDEYQLKIYDTSTNETLIIASGDYSYPVFSANGETLVVGKYNYSNNTMDYFIATKASSYQLRPLIENGGVGSIRISSDGREIAFYSSNGLFLISSSNYDILDFETIDMTGPTKDEDNSSLPAVTLGLTLEILILITLVTYRKKR
ncbi:MAG: hypothetical protein ACTSYA_05960 [Candidatus Kariarchaeaceae archaeon]